MIDTNLINIHRCHLPVIRQNRLEMVTLGLAHFR